MKHNKCDAYNASMKKLGHDIANQLTIISAHAELMFKTDDEPTQDQLNKIETIQKAVVKIQLMTTYALEQDSVC